jgi:hypothetical protein
MTRLMHLVVVAAVLAAATPGAATQPLAAKNVVPEATALYCQVGGIGLQPPDAEERFFGIAVIELKSAVAVEGPKVTSFDLVDAKGVARATLRRVTNVLEFTRPRTKKEGIAAYYFNTSGNRPWSGMLPAGVTRLQIHVSFDRYPVRDRVLDLRCRIGFGSRVIERGIDSEWPT